MLVAASLLLRLTPPWVVNHDCGWYLYVAHRLAAGDVLYADLIDVNPPLITYLTMVPVALARWTGVGAVPMFDLCVVGLIGCSLLFVARVVGRGRDSVPGDRLVLAVAAFVLTVVPGGDFGQREHLIVLLALPYFAVVATRLGGADIRPGTALATGLCAAVGLCLKPYFLLAPLLVWVGTVARRRRLFEQRRPENEGLIVGLCLYGLHFFLIPNRSEFARLVDLVRAVYGGYDIPFGEAVAQPSMVQAWIVSGMLVAGVALARRQRPALEVLLLAQLGAIGAALWQAKGWSYHVLPALLIGGLGLVVYWWANRGPWLRAILMVGLLGYGAVPLGQHWLQRAPADGSIQFADEFTGLPAGFQAVRALQPGEAVLVLDTRLATFFGWMADRRLAWGSRYACLWVLPGADPAGRDRLRREVIDDLAAARPRLVFVCKGLPWRVADPDFDLLTWVRSDADGRRVWSGYEPAGETPEFTIWSRRRD